MLVKSLLPIMKLVSRCSNTASLTNLYHSVELGPDAIRAISEFANIEFWTAELGLKETVLLDTSSVLAVIQSLPASGDLILTKKDTKVEWSCGQAKGHWNLVATDNIIPKLTHDTFPWEPDETFPTALLLASSACQAAAVSVGLYGITIEPNGDKVYFRSSNSISLSSSSIPKGAFPSEAVTIRPPVPHIIASIMATGKCIFDINEDGIYVFGDKLTAHLPLGEKLEHDLKEIASRYENATQTTTVDTQAIRKFIARARALTDKNVNFEINLSVDKGRISLQHSGIASSTEEFFVATGLPEDLKYESIPLPADMLLLPLASVENFVLDYLDTKCLVLKGTKPDFTYVLSGGQ